MKDSLAVAVPSLRRMPDKTGRGRSLVQAERPWGKAEWSLRAILNASQDSVFIKDRSFRLRQINHSAERLFGIKASEPIRKSAEEILGEEAGKEMGKTDSRVLKGEVIKEECSMMIRGTPRTFHVSKAPIYDRRDKIIGVCGIARDITERMELEKKIRSYQEQLHTLTSELSATEERGKQAFAADLHDHVGQTLALAKIKLGALRELLSASPLAQKADEICGLIEQTIVYTRTLVSELAPPFLSDLGLEAAVECLAQRLQDQRGILFDIKSDAQPKPLDDNIRLVLFQAVRELMINVIKHSQARRATVVFRRKGQVLRITVDDDGVGLGASRIGAPLKGPLGFGILSIRERLKPFGGRLEIKSGLNSGTQVALVVPLRVGSKK